MPIVDVKQTVDKVGAYIDALEAAKRATTDQSIIDEIDSQIRKYSAIKIRYQMELGERTARMEKNTEFHGNQHSGESRAVGITKTEALDKLGISSQRASEYERLVKPENRTIVEQYLVKQEEAEKPPTLSGALNEIKEAKRPHVTNNSKDDEWYTPAQYIEAAREVMGHIDLDPASNDFANQTVKASEYYTEETNGLLKEWYGNIWMNPPYSTALLSQFADKLANSSFEQAIILVNNATETAWFEKMVSKATAVVFHKGRIRFVKRDGEHGAPLQGQAFIYYGDNAGRFLDVFGQFGWGARL